MFLKSQEGPNGSAGIRRREAQIQIWPARHTDRSARDSQVSARVCGSGLKNRLGGRESMEDRRVSFVSFF